MKKIILSSILAISSFAALQAQTKIPESKNELGNNIVRFTPLMVYDVGVGLGLSYERHLDKEQRVSVVLPVDLIMIPEYNYNSSRSSNYFYFSPGFKFYPTGQKRVTYALGANMILGFGNRYDQIQQVSQNGTIFMEQVEAKNTRLGVLVNNYLNFNIGKRFAIGLNGGLGVLYINKYEGVNYIQNFYGGDRVSITGQFAFNFGVRF